MNLKFIKTILVLAVAIFLPSIANAWVEPVPGTGQTACYDNSAVITCPKEEEAFFGQDANYAINLPSYTKLDAQGDDLPNEEG